MSNKELIIAVEGPLQVWLLETYFKDDASQSGGFIYESRKRTVGDVWKEKAKNWENLEVRDGCADEANPGKLGWVKGDIRDVAAGRGRPGINFHAGFGQQNHKASDEIERIVTLAKAEFPTVTWERIGAELHALSRIFGGRYTEAGANFVVLSRKPKEEKPKSEEDKAKMAAPKARAPKLQETKEEGEDAMGKFILTKFPNGATSKRYISMSLGGDQVAEIAGNTMQIDSTTEAEPEAAQSLEDFFSNTATTADEEDPPF